MPQKWVLKIKDLGHIPRVSEAAPKEPQPSSTIPSPVGFLQALAPGGQGGRRRRTAPAWHVPSRRWPAARGSARCALQDTKGRAGLRGWAGLRGRAGPWQQHREAGGSAWSLQGLAPWCQQLGKPNPARNPLLTLSFIHHRMHHHGVHLPVQVKAQLERDRRRGLVRWSSDGGFIPHPYPHLTPWSSGTHLLLAPLGGVDGVGRHAELLAHPPLVVHRL